MASSLPTAPVCLASTLLHLEQEATDATALQLPTGCRSIDVMLGGGLRYGEIATIAGSKSPAKSVVVLHFIASHLLTHVKSDVVVVDSTGAFPVEALRDVIALKLQEQGKQVPLAHDNYIYGQAHPSSISGGLNDCRDKATAITDRVKLVRIFDFTGLVETIAEVRQTCDETRKLREAVRQVEPGFENTSEESPEEDDKTAATDDTVHILDSINLILVDDFATVFSPILSRNSIEAQALLCALQRSLRHLAQEHRICAILLNNAVAEPRSAVRKLLDRSSRSQYNKTSTFESIQCKPALGQTLGHLVDVSVMVSRVPKTRQDAEMAYTGSANQSDAGWLEGDIAEVLKDRGSPRQGYFAAFEIRGGIDLLGDRS